MECAELMDSSAPSGCGMGGVPKGTASLLPGRQGTGTDREEEIGMESGWGRELLRGNAQRLFPANGLYVFSLMAVLYLERSGGSMTQESPVACPLRKCNRTTGL